jgi:uncharacterized membrane protein YhaH (DUF805 family)
VEEVPRADGGLPVDRDGDLRSNLEKGGLISASHSTIGFKRLAIKMKQPIRCPAGILYDGALYAACPCPSCWADRSSGNLTGTRTDLSTWDTTMALEGVALTASTLSSAGSQSALFPHRGPWRETLRYLRPAGLWFTFGGRASRSRFWGGTLANGLALVGAGFTFNFGGLALKAVAALCASFLALSTAGVSCRRLHDRDWGAPWLLVFYGLPALLITSATRSTLPRAAPLAQFGYLLAIPLLCWALIEIGCLRGTTGTNRFGDDPLKRTARRPSEEGLIRLLLSFDGRLNRARFALSMVAASILLAGGSLVAVFTPERMGIGPYEAGWITVAVLPVIAVPCLVSLLASLIRRIQDIDLNPSLLVLFVVPPVLAVIWPVLKTPSSIVEVLGFVALGCFPGTDGPNRYGADPVARKPPEQERQEPAALDFAALSETAATPMTEGTPSEGRLKLSSLLRDVSP